MRGPRGLGWCGMEGERTQSDSDTGNDSRFILHEGGREEGAGSSKDHGEEMGPAYVVSSTRRIH